MEQKKFEEKLARMKKRNEQWRELSAYKLSHNFETSKLLACYLFALLNAIVVYAMVAMWHFADLSYLGVLISDIAAQVIIYATYCIKAYKGKKAEEEIKLKKLELDNDYDGGDGVG